MMNAPDVTVRRARPDDYAQACVLFDSLDELHRDRAPWMFKMPTSQPRSEKFFAELLNNETALVLVAECGQLVGLVHGLLRAAPEFPVFVSQRWGVLDGLVVEPSWRRRGIGRLLTETFEEWALAAGAAWVELNVYEFNDEARKFYESIGYAPLLTRLRKSKPGVA